MEKHTAKKIKAGALVLLQNANDRRKNKTKDYYVRGMDKEAEDFALLLKDLIGDSISPTFHHWERKNENHRDANLDR